MTDQSRARGSLPPEGLGFGAWGMPSMGVVFLAVSAVSGVFEWTSPHDVWPDAVFPE
jgi:hypothetical protein